jgi:hypothetical protein
MNISIKLNSSGKITNDSLTELQSIIEDGLMTSDNLDY